VTRQHGSGGGVGDPLDGGTRLRWRSESYFTGGFESEVR